VPKTPGVFAHAQRRAFIYGLKALVFWLVSDIKRFFKGEFITQRMIATINSKVLEKKDLTASVTSMWLEVPQSFDFEPGQYVIISIPTVAGKIKRSYSLASSPAQKGRVELCIKRIEGGIASGYFKNVKEGM